MLSEWAFDFGFSFSANSHSLAHMEKKPLLDEESGRDGDLRRERHKRSDAIAFGSPYQKAAALVDLVVLFFASPAILLNGTYVLCVLFPLQS